MKNNILSATISLLNVKHTKKYLNRYFEEHPDKDNMFGISQMLSHYNIDSLGVQFTDKEKNLQNIPVPFIAYVDTELVTVESVCLKKGVTYIYSEKKTTIPISEFIISWTGATLLIEANIASIEPNYKKRRSEELTNITQKAMLFFGIFTMAAILSIKNKLYQDPGRLSLLLFSSLGMYTTYLITVKQLNLGGNLVNKICLLLDKKGCDNVLDSPSSKFMGLIAWSNIGLSYFLSNILILLFFPKFISYLVLINICSLPYSFWSVWYQKFKLKSWCILCLNVQVILWALFIISSIFGLVSIPQHDFFSVTFTGLLYIIPFLIINLIIPHFIEIHRLKQTFVKFNNLKLNKNVFVSLLKQQPHYKTDEQVTSIRFGNCTSKNIITVVTNPHCEPCAKMHAEIENLLKKSKDRLCVQYILSSFNSEQDSSCEFFIYINNVEPQEMRNDVYNEWFLKGKYERYNFFKKYNFLKIDEKSMGYQSHLNWSITSKLNSTPTLLFNGYLLPDIYLDRIEDLLYFIDIDLNL